MRDAIIIQQAYSGSPYIHMIEFCYRRHVAYALRHGFDYMAFFGAMEQTEEPAHGGWEKLYMIRRALERGYNFVAHLDADTMIANLSVDLRGALRKMPYSVGVCKHPGHHGHLNAGVMFFGRSDKTLRFVNDWLSRRAGESSNWQEQAVLNQMASEPVYAGVVGIVPDIYNATRAASTYSDNAVIIGYHNCLHSPEQRLAEMRADAERIERV